MKKILLFMLLIIFILGCTFNPSSNIPESQPIYTQTSLPPTLTVLQKKEIVGEYLINNNNCALPCYWGIMPGETTWEEARTFLDDFWKSYIEEENGYYRVRFEYPEPENEGRYYYLNIYTNPANNYTIVVIKGSLDQSLQSFFINNGKPERIFLRSIGPIDGYPAYFHYLLYLDYGRKGIWAKQTLRNDGFDNYDNRKLKICTKSDIFFNNSNRQEGIELVLWDPSERKITEDDPVKVFGDISEYYVIKSIEEGTGINVIEFYNAIINNTEEDYCFLVKKDDWQPIPELIVTPEN